MEDRDECSTKGINPTGVPLGGRLSKIQEEVRHAAMADTQERNAKIYGSSPAPTPPVIRLMEMAERMQRMSQQHAAAAHENAGSAHDLRELAGALPNTMSEGATRALHNLIDKLR